MKKFLAIAAVVVALWAALSSATSCVTMQGDFIYDLEISFFDNLDILRRGFDKGFEAAGCDKLGSNWHLNGEKNSCDSRVKNAFLNRAQQIDKDRSQISLPLDLKGETVTLKAQYGTDTYVLATYTFKEDN